MTTNYTIGENYAATAIVARTDAELAARAGRARANIEATALERHPGDLDAARTEFIHICAALGLVNKAAALDLLDEAAT
jgi:hypothetical protein